jgi:type II secretory pathway pseudopilin PulG
MTLIELLVVVAIVVTLLAAGVPMMQPALRDARIRESARQLNVFCTVAKGRARELGRPAGIWFDRAAAGGNAVFEIHIAEEPLPYSGDLVSSTAVLLDNDGNGVVNGNDIQPSPGLDYNMTLSKAQNSIAILVIKAGDDVQFNNQGPKYKITLIRDPGGATNPYQLRITVPSGVPAALPSTAVPYTVFRQPVKSSLPSLQLSGGTVVDLEYSGIGATSTLFNAQHTNQPNSLNADPVIMMFDTAGSVERVYTRYPTGGGSSAYGGQYANGTIHLLVGRFDQTTPPPALATAASPPATAEQTNLVDDSTVWISVGSRTGNVSSAENLSDTTVAEARLLARSAQSMGGN